jgi:hypothetical protein
VGEFETTGEHHYGSKGQEKLEAHLKKKICYNYSTLPINLNFLIIGFFS